MWAKQEEMQQVNCKAKSEPKDTLVCRLNIPLCKMSIPYPIKVFTLRNHNATAFLLQNEILLVSSCLNKPLEPVCG